MTRESNMSELMELVDQKSNIKMQMIDLAIAMADDEYDIPKIGDTIEINKYKHTPITLISMKVTAISPSVQCTEDGEVEIHYKIHGEIPPVFGTRRTTSIIKILNGEGVRTA